MSHPEGHLTSESGSFEPRHPALLAGLVFLLAMLSLCWPMLSGQYLYGSDQLLTGYAFRHFGAEYFKQYGSVPLWNPYIFGGLPFVGAMHGDIFYPAAWLRLVMPEDLAMTLAYAMHFVIAGTAMYALLRAIRVSWTGAVTGGVAYQMTGILASLVSPGHDGKLFVSALAPFFFLGLLRAVRDGRTSGYGVIALITGLCMLSPHYQLTYYLLVAGGFFTIYLVFFAEDRRASLRWPLVLAAAAGAVLLGIAISAIQAMPFLAYLPYGARGTGAGWEYATAFALPLEELVTTVLPEFNGTLQSYWGQNFFKLHTEYLGVVVMLLAAWGVGDRARGRLRWAFLFIGGFFLLVALGGHTPFYRLWYEVMPLMKKVRAAGMAFFLPAMVTAIFAAFGADRLLRGDVSRRALVTGLAVLGGVAVLGATGLLQAVAVSLARPEMADRVQANAPALQAGALRMLVLVLGAGAVTWAIATRRLVGVAAAIGLTGLVAADLWSLNRRFFDWEAPASALFAEDAIVGQLRSAPQPTRVMDLPMQRVYQGGGLMAWDVKQVFGYHGNELRFFDELWGGKNIWQNIPNLNLWDLYAVRFLVLPGPLAVPGFHQAAGPVPTTGGGEGVLFEADSASPYARVVAAAAKVPESQLITTLLDPRFPVRDLVLFPDTASVQVQSFTGQLPPRPAVEARVTEWAPGRMKVALDRSVAEPTFLVVSENWYPDWRATVDGAVAPVHRGNQALIAVALPAGAREVALEFTSPSYRTGKLVSIIALLAALALMVVPAMRRRGAHA